ncbi:MAG: aminotransferase class III-fold pyridoxal phosphate-dependent enzyme, partial [Bacteroidota bacterium]
MSTLAQRDATVIWHPYTQMKTAAAPLPIVKGEGAYLIDENGRRYLDAVASWWVNLHGHAHPYIAEKIYEQLMTLEHVIFAGFTHPPAVQLAERLLPHLPDRQARVFFSDNGSTAVEIGIK